MNNPFNPTFGDVPKIYLDTDQEAEKIADSIRHGDYAQSIFITGYDRLT